MKKAVFSFNTMNLNGGIVSPDDLLKRSFESSSTAEATNRCEGVVTEAQLLTLKYYKNTKVLSIQF